MNEAHTSGACRVLCCSATLVCHVLEIRLLFTGDQDRQLQCSVDAVLVDARVLTLPFVLALALPLVASCASTFRRLQERETRERTLNIEQSGVDWGARQVPRSLLHIVFCGGVVLCDLQFTKRSHSYKMKADITSILASSPDGHAARVACGKRSHGMSTWSSA